MASGEVHRTQLAHERTYLAWWRTGLAGIAAGFAVGRVLPEVVGGTNWPYIALGTGLAASGLAAMVYGIVHYRELQAALREDRLHGRVDWPRYAPHRARWAAQEEALFAAERPWEHADGVVDGMVGDGARKRRSPGAR